MKIKIAILRGINVGGKRKILMSDLRLLLEKIGFKDVKTYIQSGNVIFKSNKSNAEIISEIKKTVNQNFGFDVPVIIRTSEDLEHIVNSNTFYKQENDVSKLHLTFLSTKPTNDIIGKVELFNSSPDKFIIKDENVFIYCEGKYHKSKLTNNFFEKKLEVEATTRNWKTVLKLLELSKQ